MGGINLYGGGVVASVPQSVTTGFGNTLTITAYNPATGLVSYSCLSTDTGRGAPERGRQQQPV
ncbi:hypothetical protein P5G63_00030 [Aeromonas salmonicida]|nr:hypothetical protein [Aeromonas salmonicida]